MAQTYWAQREAKVGEWRCVVTNKPWGEWVEVWLMRQNNGINEVAFINQEGLIETKKLKEGDVDSHKPLMTLNYYAWQAVLSVMGEIKPDIEEEVVEAELKATKFHLEDMRKLVFENKT